MKKFLLTLALVSGAMTARADFVAAWDFSMFTADGYPSFDDSTYALVQNNNYENNSINASSTLGNLYLDGQYGSTNFANGAGIEPAAGYNLTGTALNGQGILGEAGSINVLKSQSGRSSLSGRALGFTSSAANDSFVIEVDMGTAYNFTELALATTSASGGTTTITWSYDLDGSGSYTSLGETTSVLGSASADTLDLSGVAALQNVNKAFFKGTFGTISSGTAYIDNLSVNAVVVPEPSTYAALLGAVALGVIALRRRK